jgi:hypothetical protein
VADDELKRLIEAQTAEMRSGFARMDERFARVDERISSESSETRTMIRLLHERVERLEEATK